MREREEMADTRAVEVQTLLGRLGSWGVVLEGVLGRN